MSLCTLEVSEPRTVKALGGKSCVQSAPTDPRPARASKTSPAASGSTSSDKNKTEEKARWQNIDSR